MKRILTILLLLIYNCSSGQEKNPELDSLLASLKTHTKEDEAKVNLLVTISFSYRRSAPDVGIKYATQALGMARNINMKTGIAAAYNALGTNYKAKSEYDKALACFQEALKIFEERKKDKEAATVLMNIGTIYRPMKQLDKALECYQKAVSISKRTGNKITEAKALGNIAVVYMEKKEYRSALSYDELALKIFRELHNEDQQAWILSNMGDVYEVDGDLSKALAIQYDALAINKKLDSKNYLSGSFDNIGRIHVTLSKNAQNASVRVSLLNKGIIYYDSAIAILEELGDIDYLGSALFNRADAKQLAGNYKGALEDYQAATEYKDSIFSKDMQENIAGLETKRAIEIKDRELQIARLKKRNERFFLGGSIVGLLLVVGFTVVGYRRQKRSNVKLNIEKRKSDELLLNILPAEVAEELKEKGSAAARHFDNVTVLFTDFANFTQLSEKLNPQQLVDELHTCFKKFDEIINKYGIEKIKTIGDAYLAVSGLPNADPLHAHKAIKAGIEMMAFINERKAAFSERAVSLRIGINSGSVVAGIVGVKKFAYDIWGDTVNTAARMEQNSAIGKINVSQSTYELVKNDFVCSYRGEIDAKNKGMLKMYFIEEIS